MDRVFPENMNPINAADPQAAINTIDVYLRYMRERIEYAIGIITKLNSGTSVADLAERMAAVEIRAAQAVNAVASVSSTVSTLNAQINGQGGIDERLLGAEGDIGLIYQDLDEQGTGIGYRVLMLEQQVGNIASVLAQI